MVKYFFSVSYGDHWLQTAIKLKKNNIAKPVLWLGDNVHYLKAKEAFGEVVLNMETFVHHPFDIKKIEYNAELCNFFDSPNYLRAKDRCFKMMDRLDLYGTFGRIDREAYFHNLLIFYLKYTSENRPDVFLCIDNTHSHAQYLLYEICTFLQIPTFKFNNFVLSPSLFIENINTGERFKFESKSHSEVVKSKIKNSIQQFVKDLKEKKQDYDIFYVKNQKKAKSLSNRLKTFFTNALKKEYREIRHHIGLSLKNKKSDINPYRLNYFVRRKIKKIRKKRLYSENAKAFEKMDYSKEYVYYPLHYEHERTTNPDGGNYQDQFKTIVKLRAIVPNEIQIVVKEHPFQFFYSDRGSRGRSPFFYKLIKNIDNVRFINTNENSIRLILNSIYVATITGTVALEASVLGKKTLYFGNPWYRGLPNTFSIKENPNHNLLINSKINDPENISEFLNSIFENYSVLAFMNYSQKEFFKNEYSDLVQSNNKNLYRLMENFFETFQ